MSLGNAIRAPQDSLRPEDNFILWLNVACRFPSKNGGGEKKIRGKNTFHNKSTGELRHNGSVVKMFALMAQRGGDLNLPKLTFVSRRYADGQMLLFEIEFWVPRIGHWHLRVHFLKLKHDLIRLQRMSVSTNESQSVGRKWNSAVIYGFGWHLTKCHVSVLLFLRGALLRKYNFPSFRFSNFAILANITKQEA